MNRLNRPGGGQPKMRLKSRFDRGQRGRAHANILGESTDQNTLDAAASEFIGQSGRVEGGTLILAERLTLGDYERIARQSQCGVKFGALASLHAMHRPDPAERMKTRVIRRMPITRSDDERLGPDRLFDKIIDYRNDFVGAGNGQGAAGAKIALDIDDQQSIAVLKSHVRSGHDNIRELHLLNLGPIASRFKRRFRQMGVVVARKVAWARGWE